MYEEDATKVINTSPFHSTPLVDLCLAVDFSYNSLSVSITMNYNNSTQIKIIEMKQARYAKSDNST